MSKRVSVAACGIGGYGEGYVRSLLGMPPDRNAVFAAAVDTAPERCSLVGEIRAASIPVFSSLEEMYAKLTPDLVVLSTPIHLHAPQALLALARGSSVLCEKPVAATVQDTRAMTAAARKAGKIMAVGYQWSFSEAVQALKRDIMGGRFGRPRRLKTLVLWPRAKSYYARSSWAGKIKSPRGDWVLDSPANNATAHYLHNMLYILGKEVCGSAMPATVQAELYRANEIENYDTAAMRVGLPDGVEMLFYTTHAVNGTVGPVACYEFENATISYEAEASDVFVARTNSGETIIYGNPNADGMRKLWHTIEAVREGACATLCDAAVASAQTVCVEVAQKSPIVDFPKEGVRVQGEGLAGQVWKPGLAATLVQCYNLNLLPAELGAIPWARKATTVAVGECA